MKIADFDFNKNSVFIVAELSANHAGQLSVALETIKAAKEAGADAVKIQTFTPDSITMNSDQKDFLIQGGTLWDGKNLYDLYEEAQTPREWHRDLFDYAKEIGIILFSSPFSKQDVDFLKQFDPPAYKIASFEITDVELIRYVASQKKPIIISTGIAKLNEIEAAVEICRQEQNENIILLKCTSQYPAPLEEANLVTMSDMADRFKVRTGFSDHTLGISAPVVATTLGACMIEKHFILDKSLGGPDKDFSLDSKEMKEMVEAVRAAEKLIGQVSYDLSQKGQGSRRFARSLYVAKDISKGEVFTEDNIKSVRPGYGTHPHFLKDVLGTESSRSYKKGERLDLFKSTVS